MSVKLKSDTKETLQELVNFILEDNNPENIAELDRRMDDYNISYDEINEGEFEYVFDYDDLIGFIQAVQSIVDYIKLN